MTLPLERVAQVLCKQNGETGDGALEWEAYMDQAREVIEAVKAPSWNMTQAGGGEVAGGINPSGTAQRVWGVMVRELLKNEPPKYPEPTKAKWLT